MKPLNFIIATLTVSLSCLALFILPVFALASYEPTGGALIVGTQATINASTSSGNVGSWKGTLAQDATAPGWNWTVNTNATTGLDQQLYIDNVMLNGANKMMITMRALASVNTINRLYQICDWVSSANVDNAADANCTTGGWRTLNLKKANITSTTITNYTWHIYDGYWTTSTTGNVTVSTPLSNFVRPDSTRRVLIRAFSTSAIAGTHTIDWVRINPVIDSMYSAGGFTQITGGTVATSYINTINGTLTGQTAVDSTYLDVPGTASAISDFYLSYKNVKTFTGMNTVVVVATYGCSSAVAVNIKPKIYNFTTTSWVNLTTSTIACSTTLVTGQFALNNVTMSDYISSGEIRVGWFGSAANAASIRIDMQYLILGATNTDSSLCEISFGTGTATDCTKTRDLDSTLASPVTWQQTSELESATFGHTYYAQDNDGDGTTGESASSANLSINITPPTNASIVFLGYAARFRSNATTMTAQAQFKDNQGDNPTVSGGWTAFGATNALTTYTYEDFISNGNFTGDPNDYIDQANDRVNIRVRTTASTATTGIVRDIDFALATLTWTEDQASVPTLQSSYLPTGGALVVGTEATILSSATSGNVGSWKGTLAQDATAPGWNWTVNTNATTGLNQQLYIDNVMLNGANKMMITMRALASVNTINRLYQICDWVSSANVDSAADANCTTGGWRTLNLKEANITSTTITNYTWHIYDGYWTTSTTGNVTVSTPLSNFVKNDASKRVLIRAYSSSAIAGTHTIDWLRISPVIDSMYSAGGFTQITGGTVATSYINTINGTLTGQTAVDSTYLDVPGTASAISDFYLSYKNIKTYTGMNTVVVVATYGCSSAVAVNIKPKIYNFTTTSWVNLTTSTIACSTTLVTGQFALNNVNLNDYLNGGEIRVGWFGSAANAASIRLDMQYLILGSTNTDSSLCEISFGTGTATDCSRTRDLDSTLASPVTWQQTAEIESATFGHTFYGLDNDADTTSAESASSANLSFPVTPPGNSALAFLGYAVRFRSNATTMTAQAQYEDNFGDNATISGGWTAIGATNALTTYTYSDQITNGFLTTDAADYIDQTNDLMNMRFRTTASTATTGIVRDIDFAMAAITWVEGPAPQLSLEAYRFFANPGTTDVGAVLANTNAVPTLASSGAEFRLRVLLHDTVAQTPINTAFKLQYAGKGSGTCAAPSGGTPAVFTDVDTTTLISYKDNATPADGVALTPNANDPPSSYSMLNQTYEELNNFSNSISAIPESYSAKWDFSLYDHGAAAATSYCFRIFYTSGSGIASYAFYPEVITSSSTNSAPNQPTALTQTKVDTTVLATGDWTNLTSVRFTATATDPNSPDTLYLCVEKKPIANTFAGTEDLCGSGVAYSGTGVSLTVTITNIPDATEYHWQARVKDTGGLYSGWVSYDTNLESARDFGIDTTAPTALSVYDGTGTGADAMFNDGSLSALSANWGSLNANVSGLQKYEYSIGTTAGAMDIKTWTDVATATSVSVSALTLQSSQPYFFNIRVTDKAGNTAVFSSDGQRVAPSLSFSLSTNTINFANLNNGNSFTDTQTTTLTTSTNAYGGYIIRLYKADSLRSLGYPSVTIGDFNGGTYASPAAWGPSNYGFGYNSSDTSIQGVDKFNAATCPGGGAPPCFAPFSSTAPGDIVADHTANVSGTPITNEQFIMTYKIKTPATQNAGKYQTSLLYTVIPQY